MVVIIDYNAGNTHSVINAFNRLGIEAILTCDKSKILQADKVILPGVGHAGSAMQELINRDLVQTIKLLKAPFLGICVGMQLLMDQSEEGSTSCLGIIKGQVKRFCNEHYKVPQIGWNTVATGDDAIFKGISNESYFYFVHSYYIPNNPYSIGTAYYTEKYTAVIKKDNYYGVQFHPEKSGATGSQLLMNFLSL